MLKGGRIPIASSRLVQKADGSIVLQIADVGYRPVQPAFRKATPKEMEKVRNQHNRAARRADKSRKKG